MRILQVVTSMLPGGAERLAAELTPLLMAKGHEVDLILFDGEETILTPGLRACGCGIHALSHHKSFYNPLFIFRLRKLMRGYDVVITHNSSPQLFGAIANLWCKTPLVTTEHNTDNRKRHSWLTRIIDKWMYRQYDRIVCCSDKVKENLSAYLGHDCKMESIPNGVDLSKIYETNPIAIEKKGKKIITMVASLRKQKDHPTLLRAMAQLPKGNYELWLLGEGKLEGEARQLAEELGLTESVRFLGVKENVAEYLKASDVVVLSSHYEGLSLACIEGMASGKPFIASDVNGLREVVGGAGVLVPHEDAQALASAIKRLTDDANYRKEVVTACMERASHYDIRRTADLYHKMFVSVVSGNKDVKKEKK